MKIRQSQVTGLRADLWDARIFNVLLNSSVFINGTWDGFEDEALVDNGPSNMPHDSLNEKYTFTSSQILQSTNLFDTASGIANVINCMVIADYDDTGSPTIEASANGGANWETVPLNEIHTFTNIGTDLRIRYTANGTGNVRNWGVLYNQDESLLIRSPLKRKYDIYYFEGDLIDEAEIVNGIYFDDNVIIDKITLHARTPSTGSNITIDILKDDIEQVNLATLTATTISQVTTITKTVYRSTNKFGLKLKSIGSIEPGKGLLVRVHFYDS